MRQFQEFFPHTFVFHCLPVYYLSGFTTLAEDSGSVLELILAEF